jgi:hypothetical protein
MNRTIQISPESSPEHKIQYSVSVLSHLPCYLFYFSVLRYVALNGEYFISPVSERLRKEYVEEYQAVCPQNLPENILSIILPCNPCTVAPLHPLSLL